MKIAFKINILLFILISTFAANSMLQAQYATCEQDCYPPAKWEKDTVIISLPEWPGCVIRYIFEKRTCNGLHEMRGGQVAVDMPGCNEQWNWVFEDPRNEEQVMDRIETIFTQAFNKVSDDHFMDLFLEAKDKGFEEGFDCRNDPNLMQGGMTTYIRAKCASYCSVQYMQDGGEVNQFTIDDCGNGDGCCKITRTYCWDFEKDEMQVTETMETSVGDCDPGQDVPTPGCYPEGVEPMFLYRTQCKPICNN